MIVLSVIIVIVLIVLTVGVLYLYFLAFAGLVTHKKYPEFSGNYRFLILIPAYNEQPVIGRTLQSLRDLNYKGKVEIAVIADNCSDNTAAIARDFGVKVLERYDDVNRGKGYALEWAIKLYNLDNYDAVAIVDADTRVESNMLQAMAESLTAGTGAVQLYYGFLEELKTGVSYLQKMANIVENKFFYKGRAQLGLPILLRGTGMAIKSSVLKAHPWDSHSITEDVDYAVNLLVDGVKIDFNVNSMVMAAATSSYQQSHSQRLRWASGTFELIKNKMLPLIKMGLTKSRPDLIELSFSFLLLSRPLLIYIAFIMLVLSLFTGSARGTLMLWAGTLVGLLVAYLLAGIFFMKEKGRVLKSLLQVPVYACWFVMVQVKAIIKSGKMDWKRTERKIDE
ncbi:MAG: hypothetical protein CVT49_04020 [candidate division Zixibacteria bacterium HGW-Zixibacteria-1]|nr:MAG: hypothetical protein CVT49_04020 [candidate division Zixibacteria bacterium HGW-Zixibacteria-1]